MDTHTSLPNAAAGGRALQPSNLAQVVIRPFSMEDRQAVVAFFDAMGGESRGFFNRGDGNRATALRYFSPPPDGIPDGDFVYFLAEADGLMVGYVFLYEANSSIPWLGIAVREEYKGMHIGRQLMAYAKDYAVKHGKGGLLLTTHVGNLRGQALYERSGYTRLGMHSSGEVLYLLKW